MVRGPEAGAALSSALANLLGSFPVRRLFHGLVMYVALVLAMSAIFNQVAEKSLRARIEEEVVQVLRSSGNLEGADFDALRASTFGELSRRHHLDEPWLARVLRQAGDVLTFRFGRAATLKTSTGDRAVLGLILEALPNTLLLFGSEAVAVMALGLLVGLFAARKRGGALDRGLTVLPMFLNGFPSWWIGMLALMGFAYALPIFPSGGIHLNPPPAGLRGIFDLLWHLFLPLFVLVALNLWGFALQVRSLVGDLVESPWIGAARARGVPERSILFRHVLAGARPALLTMIVMGLLQSLSGNLLIEGIFGWPGLGNLYFIAVGQADVPVLLGVLAVQTLLNLAGLVGLDLAYRRLDPRIATRDLEGAAA
jgi:peptide/nickel transport system permease protein